MKLVYLRGSPEVIAERLRKGHFADAQILRRQLATLEEPEDAVTVDVGPPSEALVAEIRRGLGLE